MCGIVGIYSHEPVAAELLDSLIHLQHRGQDAAGILTADERFHPKHGIGLAHNGNLTNYQALAHDIRYKQFRHLNSSLDSEALLLSLADNLAVGSYADDNDELFFQQLCAAIKNIYECVEGSYSVVSLVIGKGLVAF